MNPAYLGYFWCLVSSLFSALATYLIKRSTMNGVDWNLVRLCWLGGAVSSYVIGFGCYSLALARLQMSLAYPVMTAFTMVLVTTIGVLALNEDLTPSKVGGMAMLVVGAWLLTR